MIQIVFIKHQRKWNIFYLIQIVGIIHNIMTYIIYKLKVKNFIWKISISLFYSDQVILKIKVFYKCIFFLD